MEDLELKELLTKVFIWVSVFIVFGGLLVLILYKKFNFGDVSVGKRIDNEESFLLLIVNEKNKNPKSIKDYLDYNDISYEIVNSDRERYYEDFLRKLNITKEEIIEPSLIDIREGKVYSILVDAKEDDLKGFVNSYNGLEEE